LFLRIRRDALAGRASTARRSISRATPTRGLERAGLKPFVLIGYELGACGFHAGFRRLVTRKGCGKLERFTQALRGAVAVASASRGFLGLNRQRGHDLGSLGPRQWRGIAIALHSGAR